MLRLRWLVLALVTFVISGVSSARAEIPLPEHPRPDFQRADWINLNGDWGFWFDKDKVGERDRWFDAAAESYPLRIRVPYPWGSKLSGVPNDADIAWYARSVQVPASWQGKRIFLVVGASDWKTDAWLDGQPLGTHQGGYTPFEFELTRHARPGADQRLVLRVDDAPRPFKLEGKQGYGNARGIWQTAYLEARPAAYIDAVQMHPRLASKSVDVRVKLSGDAPDGATCVVRVTLPTAVDGVSTAVVKVPVAPGAREAQASVSLGDSARSWSLDDPYLYAAAVAFSASGTEDVVSTYFGLREIGTTRLPGLDHPYVSLNGQPVYLQMTLDQSWNADGFWNWPTDEAMREEVLIARRLGLNTIRTHVKVEVPRKLYWADRLGVLVMADVPNSWGDPDAAMREDWETAMRGMLRRDFNHPAVFSWVLFNEQWGLHSNDPSGAVGQDGKPKRVVLPETLDWVQSRYDVVKQLDPTRLVEDNSPCCGGGHVKTDLNSWHMYLPGWQWKKTLDEAEAKTLPGSSWNYVGGRVQVAAPMLNSECGNVWGYEGSTGDVDWSFDYHAMMDEFRRHPKVAGWLYTEHHDVINEWNGYVRADQSAKDAGLGDLVPGMTVRDWHAPFYVAIGAYPASAAKAGERVDVPVWASFLAASSSSPELTLKLELVGYDDLGRARQWWSGERKIAFTPWMSTSLDPVPVQMPDRRALAVLRARLEDASGRVLHRNFTTFVVGDGAAPRDESVAVDGATVRVLRADVTSPAASTWSVRGWNALGGRKQNGSGTGFIEYHLPWPKDLKPARRGRRLRAGRTRRQAAVRQGPDRRRQGGGRFHAGARYRRPLVESQLRTR